MESVAAMMTLSEEVVVCRYMNEDVQYVRNGSWNVWRSVKLGAECEVIRCKIPCGKSGV